LSRNWKGSGNVRGTKKKGNKTSEFSLSPTEGQGAKETHAEPRSPAIYDTSAYKGHKGKDGLGLENALHAGTTAKRGEKLGCKTGAEGIKR